MQDQLIGDTLAMVNVVRMAFGKEALAELPDAHEGMTGDCLFYRALADIGVTSVGVGAMDFASERLASEVAGLWGTEANGRQVRSPHQFSSVIQAFDSHQLPHYSLHSLPSREE